MAVNFQPIYILASGGERALEQLDTVSNNIANVNTPGFKKLLLKEMSQKILDNPGQSKELFVFPRFEDTPVVLQQGSLRKTNFPLDVAIEGKGFFKVQINNKIVALTRNGHFNLDNKGYLVDTNGNFVLDKNGNKIQLDTTKGINITPEGNIYQKGQLVAELDIVDFDNIKPLGNSYYSPIGNPKNPDFKLLQGFLENSNVNPIKSMVDLINAQRRMEIYGNLMRSLDNIEQKSNEIGKA